MQARPWLASYAISTGLSLPRGEAISPRSGFPAWKPHCIEELNVLPETQENTTQVHARAR